LASLQSLVLSGAGLAWSEHEAASALLLAQPLHPPTHLSTLVVWSAVVPGPVAAAGVWPLVHSPASAHAAGLSGGQLGHLAAAAAHVTVPGDGLAQPVLCVCVGGGGGGGGCVGAPPPPRSVGGPSVFGARVSVVVHSHVLYTVLMHAHLIGKLSSRGLRLVSRAARSSSSCCRTRDSGR
jgi:hypothetical protein